jgi:hypothetical protein
MVQMCGVLLCDDGTHCLIVGSLHHTVCWSLVSQPDVDSLLTAEQPQMIVQDGQEAVDRLRRRAEHQRDTLDNQFRFAQTHTEELLKHIAGLEHAKHRIEQQAQEETLQLRQRLLEQAESSKVRH